MEKIKLTELECQKCGYKWVPRTDKVYKCPNHKCQTYLWKADKKTEDKEK